MNKITLASGLLSLLILPSTLFAQSTSQTDCPKQNFENSTKVHAGHYYLSGLMEVGSELFLAPNGQFKWYYAVGNLDQYAEGTWWQNQSCIGLQVEQKYQEDLMIFPLYLKILPDRFDVIWEGNIAKGHYIKANSD